MLIRFGIQNKLQPPSERRAIRRSCLSTNRISTALPFGGRLWHGKLAESIDGEIDWGREKLALSDEARTQERLWGWPSQSGERWWKATRPDSMGRSLDGGLGLLLEDEEVDETLAKGDLLTCRKETTG